VLETSRQTDEEGRAAITSLHFMGECNKKFMSVKHWFLVT